MVKRKQLDFSKGNRRQFLKAAGTTIAIASFAGCSGGSEGNKSSGGGTDSTSEATGAVTSTSSVEGPVKIGLLAPISGPFALTGQEIQRGTEMAKEHLNGEIAGGDIEFVVHDSEGAPSEATAGAKALVEQENVDAIVGPSISSSGLAVLPYIRDQVDIPIFPTHASTVDEREGENCIDNSFFVWPGNRQTVLAGVDFIYDLPDIIDREFDPNKMHFFSLDYALGQGNLELVKEEVSARGGEVTGSTLAPVGTQDFSSHISEIANSDADVVTGVMTNGMATRFIEQANNFGLDEDKIMMFNSGKPVDPITQQSVGAAADGWYGTVFYNPTGESEINKKFRELYPDESDLRPNASCGSGFEPVRAIAKAAEKAGSTKPDDLVAALQGLSWNSIFGSVELRASDGQMEIDFVGATREDTEFTALKEYPDVIPENRC